MKSLSVWKSVHKFISSLLNPKDFFRLMDMKGVLASGIEESEKEKENFKDWRQKKIDHQALVDLIIKDLRNSWGFKAAACWTRR